MKPILDFFADSFYSLPVLMLCQVIASFVSYRHRREFKELGCLHYYPIASLLQVIISLIGVGYLHGHTKTFVMETSIDMFVFVEILILYKLFFNIIRIYSLRRILKFSLVGFFAYVFILAVFTDSLLINSSKIILGETCIILVAVCLYFIQLLRQTPTLNVIQQATFWITTGILIAFTSTLPSIALGFFGEKYLISFSYYQFINFIAYSVMFIFLIKGYLCRRVVSKGYALG